MLCMDEQDGRFVFTDVSRVQSRTNSAGTEGMGEYQSITKSRLLIELEKASDA